VTEQGFSEPWWKSAVVYQIYPRSFLDADGDGVGDLAGIRAQLDYLQWLGVDAVWLSPFFRSPMADFGYDVADYCEVDPLFGDLAGFDDLVADSHARGIRVVIDWVPNHTSDQHPWFRESRSSRQSPKRDWYYWRDGGPDHEPNNWLAAFGGRAWTWDEATGQWYLHLFLPEQPDLNWGNPEVRGVMYDTLRFWLDRGVDGFRMDVIHGIGRDPALPDARAKLAHIPWSALNDHPSTHSYLREIRRLVDSYPGNRLTVGEVYLLDTKRVATYYGQGDELHLAFNFPPLFAPWTAEAWRQQIAQVAELIEPTGGWPTWVLSNHDNPRHRTRYGTEARARAAAVLLLTLRGTPFLYAGEELGLEDAVIPGEARVDPGGRDGCRAPVPWDATPTHGWPASGIAAGGGGTWLPWPPGPEHHNLASARDDPDSILHLYRRLLAARRNSPALQRGDCTLLATGPGVLGFTRRSGADVRTVLVNFTPAPVTAAGDAHGIVEVASDRTGEGLPFGGNLGADQAVILTGS
jgi:alpha-glucosidase